MTVEALTTATGRNPRTVEEARAFVQRVEQLFMPWNVEGIVDGFTDDCVVKFGALAPFRGKDELRKFFQARRARQKNYRLTKELRSLAGDTLANYWEGSWEDAKTGARMAGRGVEIWVMREGRIALWEAAFNVSPADAAPTVANILD